MPGSWREPLAHTYTAMDRTVSLPICHTIIVGTPRSDDRHKRCYGTAEWHRSRSLCVCESGYCATDCTSDAMLNHVCDAACMNYQCGWDQGGCGDEPPLVKSGALAQQGGPTLPEAPLRQLGGPEEAPAGLHLEGPIPAPVARLRRRRARRGAPGRVAVPRARPRIASSRWKQRSASAMTIAAEMRWPQ